MSSWVGWCAMLVYLLPVAVLGYWCSRRTERAAFAAVVVPFAVGLDLLAMLVLTWFVRLEQAAWISRILWAVAGLFVWRAGRTGARSSQPFSLGASLAATAATFTALLLSMHYSRVYSIWDRWWHVGLVTSLRGQALPFRNVYEYAGYLRYHFSGDAIAAALQAFSLNVLHADFALSLAHDTLIALTGFAFALLARRVGRVSAVPLTLALLAVLLNGPVTLLREAGGRTLGGYSVLNFWTMSFRPHVSLSGLLFIGVAGCLWLGWRRVNGLVDGRYLTLALPVLTAALAIADETSTALVGLSLGAVWLLCPHAFGAKRWHGLALLAVLGIAFVGTSYSLGASFAPGAPVQTAALVPWRSPGYGLTPVPLSTSQGRELLLLDMLGPALTLVGLASMRAVAPQARALTLVFYFVLTAASLFGLCALEFNHRSDENHRFATLALFFAPVLSLWALRQTPRWSLASICFYGAVALPALSTAAWMRLSAPGELKSAVENRLGHVNCREWTGAFFNEPVQRYYVAESTWYVWGGCRPSITAGRPPTHGWPFSVENSDSGLRALKLLHDAVGPGAPLPAICPRTGAEEDVVCRHALSRGLCRTQSPELLRCELSDSDRAALLSGTRR